MKRHFNTARAGKMWATVAFTLLLPLQAFPAEIELAPAPLANSTTTSVLPNLMFIIDGSRSMGWNYLPDWVVNDNLCKSTGGSYDINCGIENSPNYLPAKLPYHPPFLSPDFNGIYYNPDIEYKAPINADGTSKPDQATPWTAVQDDAFGIQSATATNLITNYPDMEWCTAAKDVNNNYTYSDCLRNDNYILPGTVNSKAYTITRGDWCNNDYSRCLPNNSTLPGRVNRVDYTVFRAQAVYATGSGSVATGAPSSPTTASRTWGPHYYRIIPGEYCDSVKLSNCQATQTPTFSNPARVRWCNSAANAALDNPATNSCQALRTGSFTHVRYPTRYARGQTNRGRFQRVDIVPSTPTYSRAIGRADCRTSDQHCTYVQEMTNFANWWTYYRTRMQTMKTSASHAFREIDNRYRVGFIDIYGGSYLPIATFNRELDGSGVKDLWYQKLFAATVTGGPDGYHSTGTPLRSALSRVGLIFAGKKPVGTSDPIQYSCQQNFALLTTDGYWNGDTETVRVGRNDVTRDAYINGLNGNLVGNADGGSTERPMYEGPTATSNTLSDVAKYYYDTDLRTTALDNCTGAEGVSVCTNNVFVSGTDKNVQQHMTTFTLGLGIDGSLTYASGYKTAPSGDYYNIEHGSGAIPNWPVPASGTETAVDDLWHAAVNGQGTYFSAKNPKQLTDGLTGALAAIGSKLGAGSAAATSSLNPVAGDNFAYVASYTTFKWQGNLEARTINLTNGEVSESPSWCVENTMAATCSLPGAIVKTTTGNSDTYFCATPNATTCDNGTLGQDRVCRVEVAVACTGTMGAKIANNSRVIKMSNGAGALVDFSYLNLTNRSLHTHFAGAGLSQWATFSEDQKLLAAGANMVSYLRGQTGFEMGRTSNTDLNQLYRYREATLGDATESQPAFVGKPVFKYADTGYSTFTVDKTNRAKTVYIGANDGMLHAFNAENGQERWAFVPTAVIPNLWRLADRNYGSMHTNYVNGRPIIADVYDQTNAEWRTILVAGLNGGGRGYYALDITNPASPSLLWEIDSTTENNLGYSYGYPIVTKKSDGSWVVLFTSGYNNTNPGDGKGYLYVREALTGNHIARISTDTGDTTTPSGLAKITSYKEDLLRNNTSLAVYGGDILGNLWRFDINAANAADQVMKFAILKDATRGAATQPITSAPELGLAYGKRMVFVGTGKYLENSDLENPQTQTLYAIKDDNRTVTLDNPRLADTMRQQTLTTSQSGSTRSASDNVVNLKVDEGWFIDLPERGERIHVEPILDAGLLIVPSTVPSNTVCAPGGHGWLNYFDYLNGNNGDGIVSELFNAPIVGINVYYTPDGERHVSVVTADRPTPTKPSNELPDPGSDLPFKGKRVIWRELID